MRDAGYQAEISNGASLGNAGFIVIAISTSPKWDSPSGVAYMRRHFISSLQLLHPAQHMVWPLCVECNVGFGSEADLATSLRPQTRHPRRRRTRRSSRNSMHAAE